MSTELLASFNPMIISPTNYLSMYKYTIDIYTNHVAKYDFVALCLNSFEMSQWLCSHKPRLADITFLIQTVLHGISWKASVDVSNIRQVEYITI